MSGLISVTGHPGGPPTKIGVPISDLNAGMNAAYGILCAYIHRLETGRGQRIDTSLLEGGIAYTFWESAIFFATGKLPEPMGSAHRLNAPYQVFRTKDGSISLGAANQATWERLCETIGRPDLAADPRFRENAARVERYQELAAILEEIFRQETTAGWLRRLEEAGVPAGPIYTLAEVYEDPHVRAREMVVELEHPVAGPIRQLGIPVKLSGTPGRIARPAPSLGQQTDEILEWLDLDAPAIRVLREAGVVA
jgi:crotonobetainyl-CoA:carnitine CoA-transferase CaiB-like acyl-CoA transferase